MKYILLQIKKDSTVVETIANSDSTSFSIWFWIAIAEFAIIVFLFLSYLRYYLYYLYQNDPYQ